MADIKVRFTDGESDTFTDVTHRDTGVAIYIFDPAKNAEFRIPYTNTYGVIIIEGSE